MNQSMNNTGFTFAVSRREMRCGVYIVLNWNYPILLILNEYYGVTWSKTERFVKRIVYQKFVENIPQEGNDRVAGADGMPVWADIPESK